MYLLLLVIRRGSKYHYLSESFMCIQSDSNAVFCPWRNQRALDKVCLILKYIFILIKWKILISKSCNHQFLQSSFKKFCLRRHWPDHLPTPRRQTQTFDQPPTYLILSTQLLNDPLRQVTFFYSMAMTKNIYQLCRGHSITAQTR